MSSASTTASAELQRFDYAKDRTPDVPFDFHYRLHRKPEAP